MVFSSAINNQKRLLELAILGLEAERVGIEREIAVLMAQSGGSAPAAAQGGDGVPTPFRRKRGKMTAAQKKKIGETMRAKWAARRGEVGNAVAPKSVKAASMSAGTKAASAKKPGGNLSAAGRKKISDMMKARWAAKRTKRENETLTLASLKQIGEKIYCYHQPEFINKLRLLIR